MTVRKCSTCKHYEPAPIWRKGWCRNPLLYSPQQSHLVGEDDLDCDRGMGNYWEPIEGSSAGLEGTQPAAAHAAPGAAGWSGPPEGRQTIAPLQFAGFTPRGGGSSDDGGGDMGQYPPSGPRRTAGDGDEDDDEDMIRRTGSYGDQGRGDRQFTYYQEERYWTDYLRIAAPVLGVILLLGLAWFWINNLIGDNGSNATPTAAAGLPPIVTGSPTQSSALGTPLAIATPSSGAASQATPKPSTGTLAKGSKVVVNGTGGEGVNMRDKATTGGQVLAKLPDGTALTITGDSVKADGYTWWPVSNGSQDGFVVEDYLKPAP